MICIAHVDTVEWHTALEKTCTMTNAFFPGFTAVLAMKQTLWLKREILLTPVLALLLTLYLLGMSF